MKRCDARLLSLAEREFTDSLFTAADLLARADSSFDLLAALCDCVGCGEISPKQLGHYLRKLDRRRHGAHELRAQFDKHPKTWRFQVVEHVPLTDAEKAGLQALVVPERHETPTGVRALKRLGKAIDKAAVERAQAKENFEKLERKIATVNQISVEDLRVITDYSWPDAPDAPAEDNPFAPPPTPQEVAVRDTQPLVEAVEGLTVPQREFLECIVESRYDTVKAREMYRDVFGKTLPTATLQAWMTEENFIKAVQVRESIGAKLHGVSLASVYADLADIKRRNLGTNDRLALTAIEMLAKALGMFKQPEETPPARELPALVINLTSVVGGPASPVSADGRVIPSAPAFERLDPPSD